MSALIYPLFGKLLSILLLFFVLAAPVCLAAENLPDPTRPPALLGPSPGYGEELEKGPPPLPVLQSVILSADRKIAIISGQEVKLGEKFGDAKLIRLTPHEAALRTAEGVQVLKLFPEADKKIHTVQQGDHMSGSNKRRQQPEKKAKQ